VTDDCGIDHWNSDPAADIADDLGWRPGIISLLVPSRGRPGMCMEMWLSALRTATDPTSLELVLYLDDDDPAMLDYQTRVIARGRQIRNKIGPRILLSQTWNACLELASGEILWHGNDDVLFRSPAWDSHVRQAFAAVDDRIVLVHGRDGIHDAAMATLGFYHRRWVETIGYLCPPYFSSDYNDTWNTQVADLLGRRRFLPAVSTEHLHPAVGKGAMDQTHYDRLTRHRTDNVDQLYASLAGERAADADKLRAAMT
jgi:hypothetical protein